MARYALFVISYTKANEDSFGELDLICVLSIADRAAETFRRTIKPSITWLSRVLDDGHISFVPLVHSAAVRRSWITTLRKLRAHRTGHFASETISLWIALGKAHGFSERTETAWLMRGDNAKPSPAEGMPWEHCGWSGCTCYEQRPLYKLLACTRCWKEYYCGEKCQKRSTLR